jgi:hypothetical protein
LLRECPAPVPPIDAAPPPPRARWLAAGANLLRNHISRRSWFKLDNPRVNDVLGRENSFEDGYARGGHFFLGLAKSDGADQTVSGPNGELDLVDQEDPAWPDQHGAPTDGQAGNEAEGKEDQK